MLVLHHVPDPGAALREAARVLQARRPRCSSCDMLPHDREEYRQQMGHVWLGFGDDSCGGCSATPASTTIRHRRRCPPTRGAKGPALFVATGRRAAQLRSSRSTQPTRQPVSASDHATQSRRHEWHRSSRDARVRGRREGRPRAVQGRRTSSLAEFGRKEIRLAEQEMPGLMALRARYKGKQPLAGARIMGSLHMTDPDRGADRDARPSSAPTCAGSRATSSRRRITPPPRSSSAGPKPAARAQNPKGIPVFAWKGETLEEYWWCTSEALDVAGRHGPDADRRRRRRRDAAGAQGRRVREGRQGARRSTPRASPRSGASSSTCCARSWQRTPTRWTQGRAPICAASPRRRRPACTASTR